MEHKAEQESEIEALDSIYYGEMEIIATEPFHVFVISIKSDDYEEGTTTGIMCRLRFEYTAQYPEELPIIDIEDFDNIEEDETEELLNFVVQQAKDNLGMAMVFTLVSSVQEWINLKCEIRAEQNKLEKERKKKEEEEEEQKKFEGTLVTVESFLQWKQAFEIEMGMFDKKEKDDKNKKLTGRELFMQDKSLNESDLKFLEEGVEFVKVDESLFQDLEDLEIDDTELNSDDD
ncbi:RWD domain-containing protein 1 [Cimex lectularius]|uniref:RWD domain-containing protein n=1 Tax=Cimex lectularius TaxID=79782 RepID=A0A8I6RSV5_CIMLE|nr:RWD domain-containing protein 1 [Cimex lectularius]